MKLFNDPIEAIGNPGSRLKVLANLYKTERGKCRQILADALRFMDTKPNMVIIRIRHTLLPNDAQSFLAGRRAGRCQRADANKARVLAGLLEKTACMTEHSPFYYSSVSSTSVQLPLLTVATLYFDSLPLLDPVGICDLRLCTHSGGHL
jgi:hypothetical protein